MRKAALKSFLFATSCFFIAACNNSPEILTKKSETKQYSSALKKSAVTTVANANLTWQLANLTPELDYLRSFHEQSRLPKGWVYGTLYIGIARQALELNNPIAKNALMSYGQEQNWYLGDRLTHADDHTIGQAWLMANEIEPSPDKISIMKERFDYILKMAELNRKTYNLEWYAPGGIGDDLPCQVRWCWADALFMAPPVLIHLSKATGDPKYANYAHKEFWASVDYLFDFKEHNLFHRDSRYFTRKDENGRKLFWSRGNGWVYAGLGLILDNLPKDDPMRAKYENLFKRMSASLIKLQHQNGFWASSLLDDSKNAPKETSGTAFFTFGLAWGINNGFLDKATYSAPMKKGWQAIVSSIHADGRLGWVQQIGHGPASVLASDTQLYGTGAFQLAATEIYKLSN